jgi:hypothetical protein
MGTQLTHSFILSLYRHFDYKGQVNWLRCTVIGHIIHRAQFVDGRRHVNGNFFPLEVL